MAFEDEALRAVAARAIQERTGARGLMTVLETSLRGFKFHLPSTGVKRFVVAGFGEPSITERGRRELSPSRVTDALRIPYSCVFRLVKPERDGRVS